VVITPGLATPDFAYAGKYPDGMLFKDCREFTVIQAFESNSYTQLGDNTARAIRINRGCRLGVIKGLSCKHIPSDTDIEIEPEALATCYVESFSNDRGAPHPSDPIGGLVGRGTLAADSVRGSPGLGYHWPNQQFSFVPLHPAGFDLQIGGGDSAMPSKFPNGNTMIQLGPPADASGKTARLTFKDGPEATDEIGSIFHQHTVTSHLVSRAALVLESREDLNFKVGSKGHPGNIVWLDNAHQIARIDTMSHDQANNHDTRIDWRFPTCCSSQCLESNLIIGSSWQRCAHSWVRRISRRY
jgi:hypothetical protein